MKHIVAATFFLLVSTMAFSKDMEFKTIKLYDTRVKVYDYHILKDWLVGANEQKFDLILAILEEDKKLIDDEKNVLVLKKIDATKKKYLFDQLDIMQKKIEGIKEEDISYENKTKNKVDALDYAHDLVKHTIYIEATADLSYESHKGQLFTFFAGSGTKIGPFNIPDNTFMDIDPFLYNLYNLFDHRMIRIKNIDFDTTDNPVSISDDTITFVTKNDFTYAGAKWSNLPYNNKYNSTEGLKLTYDPKSDSLTLVAGLLAQGTFMGFRPGVIITFSDDGSVSTIYDRTCSKEIMGYDFKGGFVWNNIALNKNEYLQTFSIDNKPWVLYLKRNGQIISYVPYYNINGLNSGEKERNALIWQAEVALSKKDYKKSINASTSAITLAPKFIEIYYIRAEAQAAVFDYDSAIKDYSKIIELDSRQADAYFGRGTILYNHFKYDEAIQDFTTTIRLKKDYSIGNEAYLYRAMSYQKTDRISKAISDLNYLIDSKKATPDAYVTLIGTYEKQGSNSGVYKTADRYVKNVNNAGSHYYLGRAHLRNKDYDEAITELSKAIQMYKDYDDAYVMRGVAYAYKNDWNSAIKDWNNPSCRLSITKLLRSKADINAKDANGATVVMWAIYDGWLDLVKLLYKNGVDTQKAGIIWIDKKENSYYGGLLQIAAGHHGHYDNNEMLDILRFLADTCSLDVNEGEVDTKTGGKNKWTPIFGACSAGYYDRVEFLVKKGADINVICQNFTPFEMSLFSRENLDENIPLYLIKKGARFEVSKSEIMLNAADKGFKDLIDILIKKGMNISISDKNGLTALHVASRNGNRTLVSYLISKGIDVNATARESDANGRTIRTWTPLQLAKKNGYKDIVSLLQEKGAKL